MKSGSIRSITLSAPTQSAFVRRALRRHRRGDEFPPATRPHDSSAVRQHVERQRQRAVCKGVSQRENVNVGGERMRSVRAGLGEQNLGSSTGVAD